jgi:hypothetical protein
MAGKKPAKRNVSNVKEAKVELAGKAVYYMGLKTAGFSCPTCSRSLKKGIIYEHTDGKSYCTRKCIPKAEVVE